MVSVKVISKGSGKPLKGARAVIGFSGLILGSWGGGMSSTEYTDSNGEAHFNVSPGDGTVYVNGKAVKKGYLSGMVVVYV